MEDPDTASTAMRKHAAEFGEILIKMEQIYREKIGAVIFDDDMRKPRATTGKKKHYSSFTQSFQQ
jgi:hypothetical protein